jgi:hypothetical protein
MTRTERRKYHYIYKTTCSVTDKFYIGMHSTDDLEDGYKGSGKRLWYSIRKHGKENHITEIVEFLSSRGKLKEREAELVNKELISENLCMNLQLGGGGGFENVPFEVQQVGRKKGAKNFLKRLTDDIVFAEKIRKIRVAGNKKNFILGVYNGFKLAGKTSFKDKHHSNETKKLICKIHKENNHQKGEKNSQFGTMWISNLETFESLRVNKDFEFELPWTKGRNSWNKTISMTEKLEIIENMIVSNTADFSNHRLHFAQETKKSFLSNDRIDEINETVSLYNELKSLRKVAEKLNVSHIEVRNRIKKYETTYSVSVLKTQGK